MKKYAAFFAFFLAVFFSAVTLFAQPGPTGQFWPQGFTGYGYPGQLQTVTVTQVRTFGPKMPVAISGNLVQFYGGKDLYIFRDASGEILVKIGPKEWQNLWYQGVSIDPSDTIEIYGEVHWPRHSLGFLNEPAGRSFQSTPEIHARFIKKE